MTRTTLSVAFLGAVLLLAMARTQGSAAAVAPARTVTESFAGNSRRMLVPGSDTTPLYTEEQATNGTAIFNKVCVECHEPADYTGPKFREKWNGQPMLDLYEEIRTKMPDDNPGSLTRDEYADALAYILKQNGVLSGPTKVAPDSAAMRMLKLDLPPKP